MASHLSAYTAPWTIDARGRGQLQAARGARDRVMSAQAASHCVFATDWLSSAHRHRYAPSAEGWQMPAAIAHFSVIGAGSAATREHDIDRSADGRVSTWIEQPVSATAAVYTPEVIINDRMIPWCISAHSRRNMSPDGPLRVFAASRLHLCNNAGQDKFSIYRLPDHRICYFPNLVMCRHR